VNWRWWLRESVAEFIASATLDFALVWGVGALLVAFWLAQYVPRWLAP